MAVVAGRLIFTAPNDKASSYEADIRGPFGVFTVDDMPPSEAQDMELGEQSSQPEATLNWWLIGGSIAAGIIIGPLITLLVIRRRAQHRQA